MLTQDLPNASILHPHRDRSSDLPKSLTQSRSTYLFPRLLCLLGPNKTIDTIYPDLAKSSAPIESTLFELPNLIFPNPMRYIISPVLMGN
jgi:hypothetical protein